MKVRIISTVMILLMLAAAGLGIGFAYKALLTVDDNAIASDYVTLTGPEGTVILDYTQRYDTYSVGDETMYRLNTGTATDLVKLNGDTPYLITIQDSRDVSNNYSFAATAAFPTLYEDEGGSDWCRFVFELRQHGVQDPARYYGLNEKGSTSFVFYLNEDRAQDTVMGEGSQTASLVSGQYDLDVYLKMASVGTTSAGKPIGIFVDKDNFVDLFQTDSLPITFTVEAA